MNIENCRKLIDALRSGKYKQHIGSLRIGDCYCAAGVACDISGLGEWGWTNGIYRYETDNYNWASAYVPPRAVEEFYDLGFHYILSLNDVEGLNFHQIADILEKSLTSG